jgi:2',3'-cyclic-nucleotide 2'-phosphodiesterase (5'-nucleotidase family)
VNKHFFEKSFLVLILSLTPNLFSEEIRLLYDASMNGHLAGCDCPSAPKSGLVKRATFIHDYKTKYPSALVVSGGDLFDVYPDTDRALGIGRALDSIKYDVISIGDQELVNGSEFLSKISSRLPVTSANLTVKGLITDQKFTPYVIKDVGGIKIAFVSLMNSNIFKYFQDKKLKSKLSVSPALESLATLRKQLVGKADTVVLLTHQGLDADVKFAEAFDSHAPGLVPVAFLFGAHSQDLTSEPKLVNGLTLFHSGQNGNWELELLLKSENKTLTVSDVTFHFFKYPDGHKPITDAAILGDSVWKYKYVIHTSTPDDPTIAALIKEVGP